ncbi:MAG TPA: hypothetical protein VGB51_01435 [Actinomycetota bacterium]
MAAVSSRFREFAMLHADAEAVIQRIGKGTWDCLLVDVDGLWVREVFPSAEAAMEACRGLGVRFHEGWEEEPRMVQRMNRRDHWGEPGGQRRAL